MKKHYQRLTQLAGALGLPMWKAKKYVDSGIFVKHITNKGYVYYDIEECVERVRTQQEVENALRKEIAEDKKSLTITDCRQLNGAKRKQVEASLRLEEMQKEIQELNSIIHRYYLNAEIIKKALLKYIEEEQESKTSIIETIGFFILGATLVIIAGLICIHNM